MKQISKVFISVGIGIMFLGGMLDADGTYYVFLLIAIALGAVVALVGVAIMEVENRRKDKLDADVEFLGEFEDKKIAP